jgi:hypothetical protein
MKKMKTNPIPEERWQRRERRKNRTGDGAKHLEAKCGRSAEDKVSRNLVNKEF